LPYDSGKITTLLTLWKTELYQSLQNLNEIELLFLEKIIEIIATIKYNFNLKLQLLTALIELEKED
jgi:hypothetical protein